MSHSKSFAPLSGNKLFKGIVGTKIKGDFVQSNYIEFNEGDIIYQSGDDAGCIYLILSGEVKIKIPSSMGGPSIDRKGKNDFFGEKEFIGKTSRKSSAVANSGCTIYMLKQKDLQQLISRHSIIKDNLLSAYSPVSSNADTEESVIDEMQLGSPEEASESSVQETFDDVQIEALTPGAEETVSLEPETQFDDSLPAEDLGKLSLIEMPASAQREPEQEEAKPDSSGPILEEVDLTGSRDEYEDEDELEIIEEESEIREEINASYKKILNAVHKINEELELNKILNSISDIISEYIKADLIRLYFLDIDAGELFNAVAKDEKESRIKIGAGLIGYSAEQKEASIINNFREDSRFSSGSDNLEGKEHILLFPVLKDSGELISLILLANSTAEFTKDDIEILSALSGHIALAIEKGKRFDSAIKKSRLEYLAKASGFIVDEIKTPLLIIKHYADFIKKKTGTEDIAQITGYINSQTDSVTNSVELLSDFITDKNSLRLSKQELGETLDHVLEMLAEYVETRNVKLFKKTDAGITVSIDETAFYHACFQIAKNSCDAMPEGGSIYLTTGMENDFAKIEFKDTGIGIPSIIKGRIFEPFFSFGKGKAAGLGLSIAEKVIKDLGGKIYLGDNKGEGTSVVILLPVVKEISEEQKNE